MTRLTENPVSFSKNSTHFRCIFVAGIPELSLPSLEPLVIGRLAMENGNGAVRVRAAFNNMTIRGGSNYTISWIKYGQKWMFQCLTLLISALFIPFKKNLH